MAELGETTDPRALVPGNPGGIDQAVTAWRRLAGIADQASAHVKGLGVPDGWTGIAAEAFETRTAKTSAGWTLTQAAIVAAANALHGYASTLEWAQDQASAAIDMWTQAANQTAASLARPTRGGGLLSVPTSAPAVDPGASLRRRAQNLLAHARVQLAAAGDSAASAIDAAASQPDLDADVWAALGTAGGTPQEAMALLRGLDADDLAAMLRIRPDLASTLSDAAPADVAGWWQRLDERQHAALIAAIPAVIGNLEGVAYSARDQANRLWLDEQIAEAQSTIDDTDVPPGWFGLAAQDIVQAAEERLQALENIAAALVPSDGGAERFLVSLTADSPPLAAISIGDLDTADNITYAVPGMGTTTIKGIGEWVEASANIATGQERFEPNLNHAVVAWVGYETPPVPGIGGLDFGVLGTERAEAGAARLGAALAGVEATRSGAQLNVVAHSYGTTTSSIALTQPGTHVDTFVSLGSAGLPPEIDEASDLNADAVFAGQARDVAAIEPTAGDQWAWTGRLSPEHPVNPVTEGFGAQAFGTDGSAGLVGVKDHNVLTDAGDGYLNPGTESLANVVMASTGQNDRMTAYVPPEPTSFQKALIEGGTRGYAY